MLRKWMLSLCCMCFIAACGETTQNQANPTGFPGSDGGVTPLPGGNGGVPNGSCQGMRLNCSDEFGSTVTVEFCSQPAGGKVNNKPLTCESLGANEWECWDTASSGMQDYVYIYQMGSYYNASVWRNAGWSGWTYIDSAICSQI